MNAGFERADPLVEGGWVLQGHDGDGAPLRIVFGETELARAYLGLTLGRHPALCERVIDDPSVSRRHLRIGRDASALFVEDLNSLNGTLLDGAELPPFRPVPISIDQVLTLGRVELSLLELARTAPAR
jgi:predicted component of type VI protein secretion system